MRIKTLVALSVAQLVLDFRKWWRHGQTIHKMLPAPWSDVTPSQFSPFHFSGNQHSSSWNIQQYKVSLAEVSSSIFCCCFVGDLVVENAFINWLSHPLLLSLTFQGGGKLTYDFSIFHILFWVELESKYGLEIKAVEQNLRTRIALLCDPKIVHFFIFWHSFSCDATNITQNMNPGSSQNGGIRGHLEHNQSKLTWTK